jgi:hypothetical protein
VKAALTEGNRDTTSTFSAAGWTIAVADNYRSRMFSRQMAGNSCSIGKTKSHEVRKFFASALPLLLLAAPSLWLMAVVPPLWRDADAYVQTVFPPGASTILSHGPLYCTLSRLPLWFGYLISGAGPVVSLGHFIKHTQLTDTGVFALLFLQHVGLWCAALYFINGITAALWSRLLFAIFFASQPLFYSFAHCVGSETLSMIITVFLAGAGLRIVLRYPAIKMRDWILFGALLCSSILTRHINCVLAALLPVAIFLIALGDSLRSLLVQQPPRSTGYFDFAKPAGIWITSVATGLIALILATSITHLLCWRAHIHWRSTFGYTFVWRLNFLQRVPAASRDRFISVAASRCHLPETRQLLAMLADWFPQSRPSWDPAQFVREARSSLFSSAGKFQDEKFHRSLNEMALALLCPPSAALRSAALDDFNYATQLREADVVQYLFVTTDYFFTHRSGMPQLAQLKTFREPHSELTEAAKQCFFQWWNLLSFRAWSVMASLILLMTVVVNIKFQTGGVGVIVYAATLTAFGIIMVLLSCFLAEIQPRFGLPMMEFLLLSVMILLGLIFRGCISAWQRQTSQNVV